MVEFLSIWIICGLLAVIIAAYEKFNLRGQDCATVGTVFAGLFLLIGGPLTLICAIIMFTDSTNIWQKIIWCREKKE